MSREQTYIHTKTGKKITIAQETIKYILPSRMKFLKPYETEIKQYPPEYLSRRLQSDNEANVSDGQTSGVDIGAQGQIKDSEQERAGTSSLPSGVPKKGRGKRK